MKTRIAWMLGVMLMGVMLVACGEATPSPSPTATAAGADTPTATPTDVPAPAPTPTTPTPEPATPISTSTAMAATPPHKPIPMHTPMVPTPGPAPTAVATPTPEPVPVPISVDVSTTWREIFDGLADAEQACISADVEGLESVLNERVTTNIDVPRWWQVSFFSCLDPATARGLFFSIFVMEVFTEEDIHATDDRIECLGNQMDGLDVMRTMESMASEDPAALGEMMSRFVPCLSDFFVSEILGEAGIDIVDLTDAESDCLDEWIADLDWSSVMATDDAMPAFMGGLFNCVPEAVITMFLEDDVGSLTDEESDCVRELVGNVDWAALDDEADFLPLVLGLFNCVPSLSEEMFENGDGPGDTNPPAVATPAPEPAAAPVWGSAETDREALMALSHPLRNNYSNWAHRDNWWSEAPLGEWYGVTTDEEGRVVRLELTTNRLIGDLPPELGNLSELEVLDLGGNKLSGEIPSELGNLSNLKLLNLSGATLISGGYAGELSGEIPPALGNLSKLEVLNLRGNQLIGEVPPALGNLSSLNRLDLAANELSGGIPPELVNLSALDRLYLSANELSGGIPPALENLSDLEVLGLSANELSGEIPPELGNLSNLKALYLYGNDLSGEIPPALGNLSNLIVLSLNGNPLEGCVPGSLQNQLDLDRSTFSGLPFC